MNNIPTHLQPVVRSLLKECEEGIKAVLGENIHLSFIMQLREMSEEYIAMLIEERYAVGISDIKSRSRKQHIVDARYAYCYLVRKFCNKTYNAIGNSLNRDHTSVIIAVKKVDCFLSINDDVTCNILMPIIQHLYQINEPVEHEIKIK